MAQPRGGPIATGHASHQIGLDADIWFTPAPTRRLSQRRARNDERERTWSPATRCRRSKRASGATASSACCARPHAFDDVERIFVNPAIKRAACAGAGKDRAWLAKIRPWWGHSYHFHVRLRCPARDAACIAQEPLPPGDGCDDGLDWWFSAEAQPKASPPTGGYKRKLDLADLPPACRGILFSG